MKIIKLFGATCMLLITTANTILSQSASRNLSNLLSPTAVNQHLQPNTNNSRNLGSNTLRWRNLYLANRLGINVNPQYPLDIFNTSNFTAVNVLNSKTGESIDRRGITSVSAIADGYGYGLEARGGYIGVGAYGDAGAYTGSGYGVDGEAFGTAGSRYGVFGYAFGGTFNAAGYFSGDVYAVSYQLISDRKVKTNIAPLKSSLDQLMTLKAYTYDFKTAEYKNWGLPKGQQTGLIADEVKQVFPALVKEAVHPAKYGKDKSVVLQPEEKYESINYMGLVPVIIAAMQEQQKTIEAVKAENQELKTRLSAIEQALNISSKQSTSSAVALTGASLGRAVPNPTSRQALLDYFIPQIASKAVLNIANMNGTVVKSIPLTTQGKGQVTLNAVQYGGRGTYVCTLVVDGKIIGSQRVVFND